MSRHFSGLDLIDGTPILDVKPYLPSSDSIPPEQVVIFLTISSLRRALAGVSAWMVQRSSGQGS